MLFSLSKVVILVTGATALERPAMPLCKCLQTWPGSDDSTRWAETFGNPHPSLGWALPTSVEGCTCVNFGQGECEYQFCVPDTSEGACIAEGGWDEFIGMPTMQCGTWNSPTDSNRTAPNVEPTENQRIAAQAFADHIAKAPQNDLCKCKDDWSSTKLAATYCGGNKSLAKGGVGKAECPTAPVNIDSKEGDGAWTGGYATAGQQFPMTEWCAVELPSSGSCDVSYLGRAACADNELWMISPNTMTERVQGNIVIGNANRHSVAVSPLTARGASAGALWMTFPPVPFGSLGLDWQTWFKADYEKYDKTNEAKVEALLACDADCEAKRQADAEARAKRSAEQQEACEKNEKCKAKLDAATCSAVQNATTEACDAEPTCKARAEEDEASSTSSAAFSSMSALLLALGLFLARN